MNKTKHVRAKLFVGGPVNGKKIIVSPDIKTVFVPVLNGRMRKGEYTVCGDYLLWNGFVNDPDHD